MYGIVWHLFSAVSHIYSRDSVFRRSKDMYRMAGYCRLSKEDGENRISESIENQIRLISEYVDKAGDMKLVRMYIDDGYSGLYFSNRPQFQQMMADIYKGEIQGVITKDISRLGREHIETGNYIERVFPSLGIRYVAILDGVDSLCHSNEELAQFKALLNDMYSRDISKKIRGTFQVQKKQGKYMSGFAPYGYRKDPADRHRFLIDEAAAETVRNIYTLYLEGVSVQKIAERLNGQQILPPTEYKRKIQKLSYVNRQGKNQVQKWNAPTIYNILKNQVYTGAMVQHKTEKISYKIEKYRNVPMEERYVVEGMHEAIISKELFAMAQEKRQRFKNRNS